jgi:aldehyde:ferredoxin oxidoreductase
VVPVANMLNTFPYKNRTEGQSPGRETLDGARIVESFETRGGGMHNCMTGCIVQCSNVVHDAEGNYKTSALEFETLTLLGSNCAIGELGGRRRSRPPLRRDRPRHDRDRRRDRHPDGLGRHGVGRRRGREALLREIAEGTELGRAIGNGAVATGKKRHTARARREGAGAAGLGPAPAQGHRRHLRTSPMGADHTAGLIVNPGLPPGAVRAGVAKVQVVNAACDSSGFCQFLQPTSRTSRKSTRSTATRSRREQVPTSAGSACRTSGSSTAGPASPTPTTAWPSA